MSDKEGKKRARIASIKCFKAWCSGTAYNKPNRAILLPIHKAIVLNIGEIVLGRFRFLTRREYKKAEKILSNTFISQVKV